jgi:endonuclease YncB( thermonuclease family)
LVTAVFASYLSHKPIDFSHADVLRVIDGATIELKGGGLARYIGIDCPETRRKTENGWIKASDPYGEEAKQLNEALVSGKVLRCESDIQPKDKYNRLLLYCFVKDGDTEQFVQAELLRQGLAYLYTFPPNVKYVDILVAALKEARENHRGIWSKDLLISSSRARDFIGQRKMVEGIVKKARSAKRLVRLEMEGISIIIFEKDLQVFFDNGISPAEFYRGKSLKVFGLIKEYKGEPEIIISHPAQEGIGWRA